MHWIGLQPSSLALDVNPKVPQCAQVKRKKIGFTRLQSKEICSPLFTTRSNSSTISCTKASSREL